MISSSQFHFIRDFKLFVSHSQNETDSVLYRYVALNLTRLTGYRHYYSQLTAGQWVNWIYWRKNSTTIAINIETYFNENAFYIEEMEIPNILKFQGIWEKNTPPVNQVMTNCEKIYNALLYLAGTTFFQECDKSTEIIIGYPCGITFLIIGLVSVISIIRKKYFEIKNSKK